MRNDGVVLSTTALRDRLLHVTQRLGHGAYGADVARVNLLMSPDLYARLVTEARRIGLSPAGLARECVARRIGYGEGREEADELRRTVADLEKRVAALEAERGKSDTG